MNVKLFYDGQLINTWKVKNKEHAFQDVLAYCDDGKEYTFNVGKINYLAKNRKITKEEKIK